MKRIPNSLLFHNLTAHKTFLLDGNVLGGIATDKKRYDKLGFF